MPRLVRREEQGPARTRRGYDVDLRWDPQREVAQLAIALSDGEAMIELSRETLRNLIDLAEEAERALANGDRQAGSASPPLAENSGARVLAAEGPPVGLPAQRPAT